MALYYVNNNAQPGGDHEVHVTGCSWLARILSKTPLGDHTSCRSAVQAARKIYATADGCAYCCPACHKQ